MAIMLTTQTDAVEMKDFFETDRERERERER